MANSMVSIWSDLYVATGMAEAGLITADRTADRQKGLMVHRVAVSSLIIRNVYQGDLDKNMGSGQPLGFWDWIPRCITVPEKVCGYPLPDEWSKTVRGGWHWERENTRQQSFVALARDKPLGRKIGAINNFKVEDFKGYNPKPNKPTAWKFNASFGHWVINDGNFNLSGSWQFVKLING